MLGSTEFACLLHDHDLDYLKKKRNNKKQAMSKTARPLYALFAFRAI